MYRVIVKFDDLQDVDGRGVPHRYEEGDTYPRKGVNPSVERILELSGSLNRRGIPLITPIQDTVESKTSSQTQPKARKPRAKKTAKRGE